MALTSKLHIRASYRSIPTYPRHAQKAHILAGITNSSLISIGQLCDDNCIAVLDKHKIQVYKRNTCILTGTRNTADGLWDIPIPHSLSSQSYQHNHPNQQYNAIIHKDQTKTELLQYLYGCCGSPIAST
jgi:hypothetical protein